MTVQQPQAAELPIVLQRILQLLFAKWNTIFSHLHKWPLIVVFAAGFAAVLPSFPLQILLDFLWIPCRSFCFFFLLFGWVLLSWIPAGTTPDAHFVFMDTCLLQRTLGIFWDPLSKALTSCHRRASVLQPISSPTSRHRSSLAICYKTVACSSAAQCPQEEHAADLRSFFHFFFPV